MLKEVLKHIEQRHRFLLTSHARPDGDAIGSVLACRQILRAMWFSQNA
jgi:phosphoesterase RecJ-like protein